MIKIYIKMIKFLIASLLFLSINTQASEIIGQVIKVTDGDTITILDANKEQYKVRLSGIDAQKRNSLLVMCQSNH